MIPLERRGVAVRVPDTLIGRVSTSPVPIAQQLDTVRVLTDDTLAEEPLDRYLAVITHTQMAPATLAPVIANCSTEYLDDDDVVVVAPDGRVRTLYRRRSSSNTLFATERCNSFCVMCSQPPRQVDDSWRIREMLRIIELVHPDTAELGITGGEPTLLGQGLVDVVIACRDHLPRTALHILSNGRLFKAAPYAATLGAVRHHDLMVGVPLYSDIDRQHDYVVQATGAFDDTMRGLHNLAASGVPVEIRVVIHRETYRRLPQLAHFIYRNLTFAAHVTFMGLEVVGFAKANLSTLWIDPIDYRDELESAVHTLATCGMTVSIYNHQLCTLPTSLWSFSRQSISDWKNEYAPECDGCAARAECGGFFAWNLRVGKSRTIKAIATIPVDGTVMHVGRGTRGT